MVGSWREDDSELSLRYAIHSPNFATAEAGPSCNQEPKLQLGLLTWMSGAQVLEPSCIASAGSWIGRRAARA